MRQELVIDLQVDGSGVAGGYQDIERGDGWFRPHWNQGMTRGVLGEVALLREPADAPSHV